jgi:hypothetical protein
MNTIYKLALLFVIVSSGFSFDNVFQFSVLLKDTAGIPLKDDSSKVIGVSLWDSEESGTRLYSQPDQSIIVRNGIVTVEIGPGLPDLSNALWIEFVVDGKVFSPRMALHAVHSSLQSLNTAKLGTLSSEQLLNLVQTKIDAAIASPQVTGGSIDGVPIGVSSASAGVFSVVSGDGSGITSLSSLQIGLGNVLNEQQLTVSNNLSDLSDAAQSRLNLGLGNVLNETQLTSTNNLSDLEDPATALSNLQLNNVSNVVQLSLANNLSDLSDVAQAKVNLGLNNVLNTVQLAVSDNLADISDLTQAKANLGLDNVLNAAQLSISDNLSDLSDITQAKVNLELDNVLNAEQLTAANNLDDLTDVTSARFNLGLTSLALQNASDIFVSGGSMDSVTIGASSSTHAYFTTLSAGILMGDGSGITNISIEQILTVGEGGRFITISDALDSIADNSVIRPYVIKLAPGIYNESVVMKPFVDLEGSGRHNTVIQSSDSTVLTCAETSEVRMVTVLNTSVSGQAVYSDGNHNSRLYRVNLLSRPSDTGASPEGKAISLTSGSLSVVDAWLEGEYVYYGLSTSVLRMRDVEFSGGSLAAPDFTAICHRVTKNRVLLSRNCQAEALFADDILSLTPPGTVTLSGTGVSGELQIDWSAVPKATSYSIYLANVSGDAGSAEPYVKVDSSSTSYTATGLTTGLVYFATIRSNLGVIRSDLSSEKVYPNVYVWQAGSSAGGVGFATLTASCQSVADSQNIPVGTVVPWLGLTSMNLKDRPIPDNVKIVGINGNQIKSSYSLIWSEQTLDTDLSTAANFPNGNWWTGSTLAGITTDNCSDWSDNGANGESGWPYSVDSTWIDRTAGTDLCSNTYTVPCIGWGLK